jgi:hypothetical protein
VSDKPSFLKLLNAICVGEHEGSVWLEAWAETTPKSEVAEVLRFVAAREAEHHHAFRKRIMELGFDVRWPEHTVQREANLAAARSDQPDTAKFEFFRINRCADRDIFDDMFNDKSIDPITGGLLGRYIAEERDSLRRFVACYDALQAGDTACC